MNIGERIEAHFGSLPPQQQRAAGFLLDHLPEVALYNSSELGAICGVSTATMSRLVRTLGFRDWRELKEHVRELQHAGGPQSVSLGDDIVAKHEAAEIANLRSFFSTLTVDHVDHAARRIKEADRVLVVGYRNSYPVALHLREQLSQLRTGVSIAPAPGQSLGEELATFGPRDVVILVGLRRRPEVFGRLFRKLVSAKVSIILIADPSARRYASETVAHFEVPLDSVGAMSSYTTAISLACVLENRVAALDTVAAEEHYGEINGWFDALSEIEVPW